MAMPGAATPGAASATAEDARKKLLAELDGATEAVPLARPVGIPVARPQGAAPVREKAPATPPPRMTRRIGRLPLLAGGALVVLAAVAGWWLLGSKEAPQAAAPTVPQGPARPAGGAPRAAQPAAPAPAPAAPADARSLGQLMEDAKKSMASRDYAAAVVDYAAALKREPENAEAKAGLQRAGDAYKARKLELEQLDKVRMAFADEEFTSALHILYRLSGTTDKARIERAKANGWFNLGVIALRAGECQQARAHFDEALGVRPDDEGAKQMRAFAVKYTDAQKDRSFYDQVERLSYRSSEE
jgi:hypothetical protein